LKASVQAMLENVINQVTEEMPWHFKKQALASPWQSHATSAVP